MPIPISYSYSHALHHQLTQADSVGPEEQTICLDVADMLLDSIRHDLYKHFLFDNIAGFFVSRNTCIMQYITISTLLLH